MLLVLQFTEPAGFLLFRQMFGSIAPRWVKSSSDMTVCVKLLPSVPVELEADWLPWLLVGGTANSVVVSTNDVPAPDDEPSFIFGTVPAVVPLALDDEQMLLMTVKVAALASELEVSLVALAAAPNPEVSAVMLSTGVIAPTDVLVLLGPATNAVGVRGVVGELGPTEIPELEVQYITDESTTLELLSEELLMSENPPRESDEEEEESDRDDIGL